MNATQTSMTLPSWASEALSQARALFHLMRFRYRNNRCVLEEHHGGVEGPCDRPEGCWCHDYWSAHGPGR